jgi:RNA polymerase sigma-70 factor (ECF subfamily)
MTGEVITNRGAAASRRPSDREAELVRRAQARSDDAWREIYDRHHPKVFRYVYARIGDREVAEDLSATVFLEALKSIDSYTHTGRPLLAWLYRIARNVVNYHHRSSYRRKAKWDAFGPPGWGLARLFVSRRGPKGALERAATSREAGEEGDPAALIEGWDLKAAVNALSRDQREVIILRYFVGLTAAEVASLVGKHERAVYSLQTRAIKALRRQLH